MRTGWLATITIFCYDIMNLYNSHLYKSCKHLCNKPSFIISVEIASGDLSFYVSDAVSKLSLPPLSSHFTSLVSHSFDVTPPVSITFHSSSDSPG
jgi:hypothetical protein